MEINELLKNSERLENVSPLAWTAQDHLSVGSTPPDELKEHPGKTFIDLWDDEKISDWLTKTKQDIADYENSEMNKQFPNSFRETLIRHLNLTTEHLRNIGRLPEGF